MAFLQKMKQQKLLSFALLLFTLALGIVIGTVINTGVKADRQSTATAPDATPLSVPAATPIPNNEFTKLTKRVEPSVVYIESDYLPKPGKRTTRRSDPEQDDNSDGEQQPKGQDPSDMLRHFFGGQEPRSFRTEGSGTGFVVDKNGYIITNHHVVEKADRIKVKLAGDDGVEYKARVVGYDKETDVAVLKIDVKQPLVPVVIGNSDGVQVGDWVIAIGSPFGLQATVTAGIVSAERTSRDLPGAGSFQNFLQTDAAINPGNSGGPLLNVRGEVIGVNTMIATRSGSYEGIGFALPSNTAVKVYNDIIRQGRVVRGSIGVKWSRNGSAADTLHAFGLEHGVLIDKVSPTGPAGKAGMKDDDVIVAMNDHPIKDGEDLVNKVADLPIGSMAAFTVDRDGKRLDFKMAIAERSVVWQGEPELGEPRPPETPPVVKPTVAPAKFGITIMRLTQKERQDLQINIKDGVKVVSVDPGSFADDIGMIEGDTILSINRQPVTSPDDVMKVQSNLRPGQPVAVHIVRSQGASGRRTQPERYYLSGKLPNE
jgi:serine protease Do